LRPKIAKKVIKLGKQAWALWLGYRALIRKVLGSNPANYCTNVSDASYYIEIIKNKGSQKLKKINRSLSLYPDLALRKFLPK
jgi:hypothetical protein